MRIIKEIDPRTYNAELDKTKNIIFCTTELDSCIKESQFSDIASIILTHDLNLSNATSISQNIIAIDYKPRLKICFPAGLYINFTQPDPIEITGNIFNKIYTNYECIFGYNTKEQTNYDYIILENFTLTLNIDVIQMRKKINSIYLRKGNPIANVLFTWYIQTRVGFPQIENIVIIRNNDLYQEFSKII